MVRCSSAAVGQGLESVLTPDNRSIPQGMRFSMDRSGKDLSFDVESDSAPSVVSTSAALLLDIALFEQVWLLSSASDA